MRLQGIEHRKLDQGAKTSIGIGVILILLGAFAIAGAITATLASVMLFGWVLLAAGVLQIAHVTLTRGWGTVLHVLVGVLYAVVGMLMITRPGVGAVSLTLMLAAFFMVVGVMRIVSAISVRFANWGWSIFSGLAAIALGVLVWAGWPGTSIWVIGTVVGVEIMLWGVSLTMVGIAARRDLRRARGLVERGRTGVPPGEEHPPIH